MLQVSNIYLLQQKCGSESQSFMNQQGELLFLLQRLQALPSTAKAFLSGPDWFRQEFGLAHSR